MDLEVIEQTENKLVIEIKGEDHTLLNLLREAAWRAGADQAAYMREHPYLTEPKLIIRGKNPKRILQKAIQLVIDDLKEAKQEFSRILR